MIIGNLDKDLKGKVTTLNACFNLKLALNNERRDEKSPTHDVLAISHTGEVFKIGSAWERRITKGEKVDQNMYGLSIDDPAFKTPLNCSAFPTETGFNITWERQIKADKEEF